MNLIRELQDTPLSSDELQEITGVKVLTYRDVCSASEIDQLLGKKKAFILLYESKKNWGHYTLIFKEGNTIFFFDPYGGKFLPDEELSWTPRRLRKQLSEERACLSRMLIESGYLIDYNNHRFQGSDTSTCGYHCALRLYHRKLSSDEYYVFLEGLRRSSGFTFDELSVIFVILKGGI